MSIQKIYSEIDDVLSSIENDDEVLEILEEAMNFFCSTWDICEGYKTAIRETMDDQINNHLEEQEEKDWKKLLEILKK